MVKALQRMKELAKHLKNNEDVYCLLGLGSMSEIDRADSDSDMDFFVIVKEDKKQAFLEDLSWLAIKKISYQFKNSKDGYKLLYEDGVYAEFAIFTPNEIINANFTKGLIYYKAVDFDETIVEPKHAPVSKKINLEHNLNEALTNIYVGLKRLHRGETASATTFIQVHAYHNTIMLFDLIFPKKDVYFDPYVFERRIEYRYEQARNLLENMRAGYMNNEIAAKTILEFLSQNFSVDPHLLNEIHKLL